MPRCTGTTLRGTRCKKTIKPPRTTCHHHQHREETKQEPPSSPSSPSPSHHHVYILYDPIARLTKVGTTERTVDARRVELEQVTQHSLTHVLTVTFHNPHARALESRVHDLLELHQRDHPAGGSGSTEWFAELEPQWAAVLVAGLAHTLPHSAHRPKIHLPSKRV